MLGASPGFFFFGFSGSLSISVYAVPIIARFFIGGGGFFGRAQGQHNGIQFPSGAFRAYPPSLPPQSAQTPRLSGPVHSVPGSITGLRGTLCPQFSRQEDRQGPLFGEEGPHA